MKRALIALSLLAVVTVAGCTNGGDWTPMAGGRTAGSGQSMDGRFGSADWQPTDGRTAGRADATFDGSLRK